MKLVRNIINFFVRMQNKNRTYKQLSALSDRELKDIGMTRIDILKYK